MFYYQGKLIINKSQLTHHEKIHFLENLKFRERRSGNL